MTLILVIATWLVALHTGWTYWLKEKCVLASGGAFLVSGMIGGVLCIISYGAFLKFWTRHNREALLGLAAVYLREKASHSLLDH